MGPTPLSMKEWKRKWFEKSVRAGYYCLVRVSFGWAWQWLERRAKALFISSNHETLNNDPMGGVRWCLPQQASAAAWMGQPHMDCVVCDRSIDLYLTLFHTWHILQCKPHTAATSNYAPAILHFPLCFPQPCWTPKQSTCEGFAGREKEATTSSLFADATNSQC